MLNMPTWKFLLYQKRKRIVIIRYFFIGALVYYVLQGYLAGFSFYHPEHNQRLDTTTKPFTYQSKTCPKQYGSIAMLMVVDKRAQQEYQSAIQSMLCYAQKHNYTFFMVDPNNINAYGVCQGMRDLMFKRHCISLQLLDSYDWVAAFDGDVGVADPEKCLEHMLSPHVDLVFEERFHNGEIHAGSYIVRNSDFGKTHLSRWIEYDKENVPFFHNSDNGALHIHLLSWLADIQYNSESGAVIERCQQLRQHSYDLNSYDQYVGCCMEIITKILPKNIHLIRRGHGFVRDLWVTDNKVSPVDFFLHALKESAGFFSSEFYSNVDSLLNSCDWQGIQPQHKLNISSMQALMKRKDLFFKKERYHSIIERALIGDCWPHCIEYS